MSHNSKKSKMKPWKERDILGFSSGDDDEEDFGVTLARLMEDTELGQPVAKPAPPPPEPSETRDLGLGPVPKPAPYPPRLLQCEDMGLGRDIQQGPAPLSPGLLDFEDLGLGPGPDLQQEPAPLSSGASILKSNVQYTANTNQEEDDESWITDIFNSFEGNNMDENAKIQENLQSNSTLEAGSDQYFLDSLESLDLDSMFVDTKVVDPMVVEPEKKTAQEDWFLNYVPEPKIIDVSPPMEAPKNWPLNDVPKSKSMGINPLRVNPEEKKRFEKERKKKPLSDVPKSKIMNVNKMKVEPEKEKMVLGNRFVKERKNTKKYVTESMILDDNRMGVETEEENVFVNWFPKKRKHVALSPLPEYMSTEEREDCLMNEGIQESTGDEPKSENVDVDQWGIGPEERKELEDWIIKEGIDEPLSDIAEYDLLLSLAADLKKNFHILLKLLTPKGMFEDSELEAINPEEFLLFDKPTEKPEKPKQILKQVPTVGGPKIDKEKPSISQESIKTLTLASASKEAMKPAPMRVQNVKTIQPVPVVHVKPIELPIIQLPRPVRPSSIASLATEVKRPIPGTPTVKKLFPSSPILIPAGGTCFGVPPVPPAEMRIDDEIRSTSREDMKALATTSKETLKTGPIVAMNVKKILPIPLEQQAKLKAAFPQLPRSVPPSPGVNLAREVKKPMPGTPTIKRLAEKSKQTPQKMPSAGIRIHGEKPSTSKEASTLKKIQPGPVLGQNVKKIQPVGAPLELPKPPVELPPLPRSVPAPPPGKDQPQKAVWLQVCSSIVAKQLQYLEAKEKIEMKVKAGLPPETTESFAIIDERIMGYTKIQIKILSVKWLEQFGPESMNNLRRSVTISTTQNELDNPLFAKIRIIRRPSKLEVLPVDLKYTNIFCTVETNTQMKLRDSVKGLNRALYKDGIDVIQHSFDNIRVSWIWSDGTLMILNGTTQCSLVNSQLELIPLVGDFNNRNDANLNIKYFRLASHARYPWAIDLRKFSRVETLSEPFFGERHAYYVDNGKSGAVAKLFESGEVQVFAMSTDRADELLGQLYNVAVKYRVKKY